MLHQVVCRRVHVHLQTGETNALALAATAAGDLPRRCRRWPHLARDEPAPQRLFCQPVFSAREKLFVHLCRQRRSKLSYLLRTLLLLAGVGRLHRVCAVCLH